MPPLAHAHTATQILFIGIVRYYPDRVTSVKDLTMTKGPSKTSTFPLSPSHGGVIQRPEKRSGQAQERTQGSLPCVRVELTVRSGMLPAITGSSYFIGRCAAKSNAGNSARLTTASLRCDAMPVASARIFCAHHSRMLRMIPVVVTPHCHHPSRPKMVHRTPTAPLYTPFCVP